ncbi:MAG: hypothetical protein VB912_13045, partial [Pirellulaceae bacterium]
MATQSESGIDLAKDASADQAKQSSRKAKQAAASVPKSSQKAEAEGSQHDGDEPRTGRRFLLTNAAPSWLVSLVLHTILLMVLGLMVLPMEPEQTNVLTVDNEDNNMEEIFEQPLDEPDIEPLDVSEVQMDVVPQVITDTETKEVEPIDVADDVEAPP